VVSSETGTGRATIVDREKNATRMDKMNTIRIFDCIVKG
jgi:hypothetical protein